MGEGRNDKIATPMKKAQAAIDEAAEIQKWTASDVNWLDEFVTLSTKAPGAQDFKLTNFTTPTDAFKRTTKIHLDAVARNVGVEEQVTKVLRDSSHHPTSAGSQDNEGDDKYPVGFKLDILIDPNQTAQSGAQAAQVVNGKGAVQKAGAKSETAVANADEKSANSAAPIATPAGEKSTDAKSDGEKPADSKASPAKSADAKAPDSQPAKDATQTAPVPDAKKPSDAKQPAESPTT